MYGYKDIYSHLSNIDIKHVSFFRRKIRQQKHITIDDLFIPQQIL